VLSPPAGHRRLLAVSSAGPVRPGADNGDAAAVTPVAESRPIRGAEEKRVPPASSTPVFDLQFTQAVCDMVAQTTKPGLSVTELESALLPAKLDTSLLPTP
jgi:hypothetical protein